MAVFCWGGPRLPLLLHRHALMPLQQLGPRLGGAEESIRLHLQETPNSEVRTQFDPTDGFTTCRDMTLFLNTHVEPK